MKSIISVFTGILLTLFFCMGITAQSKASKTINAGIINGKAIKLVKPVFPPAARAVGAGGSVNVQVEIDENGNIISAVALTGHPLLRQASEKAAMESKFAPTKLDGYIVKVRGVIVYNYSDPNPKETTSETDNGIDSNVLNGKALSLPRPTYPPAAKAVKASGAVNVQVTIDEEGNVISATAVSGHPLLKQSAEKAAMQARFSPTTLNGKPVKVTGIIVYKFADESDVKTVSGGVLNGNAVNLPKPVYSKEAKKAKAEGAVNVQVIIDEEGNVISTNVVSGHPLLREAAEKAAMEAKFSPTLLNGKAVKVSGILVYNFSLAKNDKK